MIAGPDRRRVRQFMPRDPRLADFSGLVVSANAATTLMGGRDSASTRLVTSCIPTIRSLPISSSPRRGSRWRSESPARSTSLRSPGGAAALPGPDRVSSGRVDRTRTVGGGVGLRLNQALSFTLIYDVTDRTSSREHRPYQRRRLFASATYGV